MIYVNDTSPEIKCGAKVTFTPKEPTDGTLNGCAPILDISTNGTAGTIDDYGDVNVSANDKLELLAERGNTVKFNQLFEFKQAETYVGYTLTYQNSYRTVKSTLTDTSNSRITYTISFLVANHTYYISLKIRSDVGIVSLAWASPYKNILYNKSVSSVSLEKVASIKTITENNSGIILYPIGGGEVGQTADYENIQLIDLTSIFGTDSEIASALGITEAQITTSTGVDAFESWLSNNIGTKDYYPYTAGTLLPVKDTVVKSYAELKNKVVQLVQNGDFSDDITGWVIKRGCTVTVSNNIANVKTTRSWSGLSQSDITIGEHKYYLNCKLEVLKGLCVIYIGNILIGKFTLDSNKIIKQIFTTTNTNPLDIESNATEPIDLEYDLYYIQIIDLTAMFGTDSEIAAALGITTDQITTDTGITAFENWLAENAGVKDYYPYNIERYYPREELSRINLPVTSMKGRLNGEGSLVTVFPDGLKKAGDVYDRVYIEDGLLKAEKKVGWVDLGSLDWTYYNNNKTYNLVSSTVKGLKSGTQDVRYNVLCFKYPTLGMQEIIEAGYGLRPIVSGSDVKISIFDSSYTDATTFKTAMSGVILYYELKTPETYILDTFKPILNRYIGNQRVQRVYKGSDVLFDNYDFYGVRWIYDPTQGTEDNHYNSSTIERIGREEWHRTLPIQSNMRRCVLADDGASIRYVSSEDYTKDTDGNTIDYTATGQDIMVEVPEHWVKCQTIERPAENNYYREIRIYPQYKEGAIHVPKFYIGAYEAMTLNSNNTPTKLYSTCKTNIVYEANGNVMLDNATYTNDAADYRGGNRDNTTYGDDTVKSLLGKPATNIIIANFATYGKARGDGYAMINWAAWNVIVRLYLVEYANFDSQAAFNSALTAEGYHQGGLGGGVTNITYSKWTDELENNPFVPCGVTNSLGSNTGVVNVYLPTDLQSSLISNVSVPSYRGIENIFGHIYTIINGLSIYGNPSDSKNYFFRNNLGIETRDWVSPNSTIPPTGHTLLGPYSNMVEQWINDISDTDFGSNGEFLPSGTVSSIDNSPFKDYFWGSNTGNKKPIVSGGASTGSKAGIVCFTINNMIVSSIGHGSRLLYLPTT